MNHTQKTKIRKKERMKQSLLLLMFHILQNVTNKNKPKINQKKKTFDKKEIYGTHDAHFFFLR